MGELFEEIRARCGYPENAGAGRGLPKKSTHKPISRERWNAAKRDPVRDEIEAENAHRRELRERWEKQNKLERLRVEVREERAKRDPEDWRRFKTYGLEPHEHQKLLAQQNGVCAICKETGRALCVDHCHRTGRVRALLCGHCNSAIGFLRESPLLARAAATYLEQQLSKEFTGE